MSVAPRILADRGELASGIPARLATHGCEVELCSLVAGDYDRGGGWLVERKAADDLAQSIRTGRIQQQLRKLRDLAAHPILLIEGDSWQGDRTFRLPMIARIYYDAVLDEKLRLVYSPTPRASATILREIASLVATPPANSASEQNPHRLNALTPHQLLLSMPGIGPTRARALEAAFPSMRAVVAADLQEVAAVIGQGLADNLAAFLAANWHERSIDRRSTNRRSRPRPHAR